MSLMTLRTHVPSCDACQAVPYTIKKAKNTTHDQAMCEGGCRTKMMHVSHVVATTEPVVTPTETLSKRSSSKGGLFGMVKIFWMKGNISLSE
jgi:hypothetical protein